MDAARNILQSLRDLGWPLLLYVIVVPLPTYLLPSRRSVQERTARLLFVGVILASIEALYFVGIEFDNIVRVARLHPLWGAFAVLSASMPPGAIAAWAILQRREDRTTISIGQTAKAEHPPGAIGSGLCIAGAGVWLACCAVTVVWLSRMSNGP